MKGRLPAPAGTFGPTPFDAAVRTVALTMSDVKNIAPIGGSDRETEPTRADRTIVALFRDRVETGGTRAALRHFVDGEWRPVSWTAYGEAAPEVAAGLIDVGVAPGDRVALLATNRVEWHFTDLGILTAAAATVPVYPTSAANQVAYIVDHCEARVAFVENDEQLAKILEERAAMPKLERVVLFDDATTALDDPFLMSLEELRALGRDRLERHPAVVEDRAAGVTPDDLATLVYTSGTTGPPKGVMLTHGNLIATIEAITRVVSIGPDDRFLSFLPLSHVAERVVSNFGQIVSGGETWFARSFATVPQDLRECRPTVFFAVPRVWQKFHDVIFEELDATTGLERALVNRFLALGATDVCNEQDGTPMNMFQHGLHAALDRIVGAKIRAGTGLDKTRILVSGAAPIHADLLRRLHAVGLRVGEVYGQTEDCGPTTLNPPGKIRIGTVGPPLPGVRVRIADDGEILVQGGNVCRGYFKDEDGTRDLIDDEGWMHSGDVGRYDAAGYLCVTGRKKDLIITAHGKNIAPQEIESRLRLEPFIAEAVVIGDARPYLTALLTLDTDGITSWAEDRDKPLNPEALAWDPDVRAEVEKSVQRVNTTLSHVETIKKCRILPRDLTIAAGEMTPTLKVRRAAVNEQYRDVIEEMYAENA
jgi:long-chain acyl-CoA synthetase